MVPWDSKIRGQVAGGNFQRVRLVCQYNWQECPIAIANYIWSEIVTDVVECVTNESVLLRLIILILVCTIFLHTIWTRAQWLTNSIVSKDSLERVDVKVQDLELRVNVLTYKMQYGTWPLPQQINGTHIEEQKDNLNPGSHNLWLNRYLDSTRLKNRHISKSENLGLRLHKPKALIETSNKIYYERSGKIHNSLLFNDTFTNRKRLEKYKTENSTKKNIEAINKSGKCRAIKGPQDSMNEKKKTKSIMKKYGDKKDKFNFHRNLSTSNRMYDITTAEASCEDSGNLLSDSTNSISKLKMSPQLVVKKKYTTIDCSAFSKRMNSTQETLTNVRERLESLPIISTCEIEHDSKSIKQLNVGKTFVTNCVQDSLELHTKSVGIVSETSNNVISQSIEYDCIQVQNTKNINEVTNQNISSDTGENTKVITKINEPKSPILIDTDEDLGSVSSQPEPSKGGSDSDKSTQSSDALMLNAILNQLDLNNLKPWNNKFITENIEDNNNMENIFPKMKNFCQSKLLDIISEEQSGNSSAEKLNKTTVPTKISLENNYSLQNCPSKVVEQISANQNNFSENKKHSNEENTEETKKIMNKFKEYSSEKSIKSDITNTLLDINKCDQLIGISDLIVKPTPGVFSITASTNISDEILKHQDDLIDLNFDDYSKDINNIKDIIPNIDDVLITEQTQCLNEIVPLTCQTVICSNKRDYNEPTNLYTNTNSKSLIELERITFEELTQVENSFDNEWAVTNSLEEISINDVELPDEEHKKSRSYNKKSSLNILSSPSSIYLTVHSSFSDVSLDSSQCLESIEKIKVPKEVKNIDKMVKCTIQQNESPIIQSKIDDSFNDKFIYELITKPEDKKDNEGEECTLMSKDSALSETPQLSIDVKHKDNNEIFINAEGSSINSSTGTCSYVDANLMCSSGISLSYDRSELGQSLDKVMTSSSSSKKSSTAVNINPIKKTKEKSIIKKVETKTQNKTIISNNKSNMSLKTKSNSNLAIKNSINLKTEICDDQKYEFGQRRSKSYIIPRKNEISPRQSMGFQDSIKIHLKDSNKKLHNSETHLTNSRNSLIDRRSNSSIKFERMKSLSKSRESVNKSSSRSCIPVLKSRLDATKKDDSRPRSPLRGPLTITVDNAIERSLNSTKNDNGDNGTEFFDNKIKNIQDKENSLIVPKGQTVIYVNIVTDHDNCVTKVLDPKKFLECVKDKDLNIQEIVNEKFHENRNDHTDSGNMKFVTVISLTENNTMSVHRQREIEILAKPSVTDTSTSISDLPKNNFKPKELTEDEYNVLLKSLGQPLNLNEFQKIHQTCSKL